MRILSLKIFIALLLLACPVHAERLSGVIHVHSTYSYGGVHSLEQIAQKAKQAGVDVIFTSDHAMSRWEYGLWPLRRLIRLMVEKQSILKAGPDRYLAEISALQKKHPDVILIPGAECAPAYFWTGTWWKKNLTIHNWHKHLLVVGLSRPEDYSRLPLVSNPSDPFLYRSKKVVLFGLASGLGMLTFLYHRTIGLLLLVISVLGFFNVALAAPGKFTPYRNSGILPYQELINYVTERGGLIFWNHPEALNWKNPVPVGSVQFQTTPYPEALLQTDRYTGFAVLWEGLQDVGRPGGTWDQTLWEYCQGRREHPVWAIGELDYHQDGLHGTMIDSVKMVFDVEARTPKDILKAMKEGRFYTVLRSPKGELALETFSVSAENFPEIAIKLTHSRGSQAVRTKLIRNGLVVDQKEGTTPMEWTFVDRNIPHDKSYYRLEVEAMKDQGRIFSNPIFVSLQ